VPEAIVVVGLGADGAPLAQRPAAALAGADLVVGGREHLALAPARARTVALSADLGPALDAMAAEPGTVCVLASGDPGFFGILRPLAGRFGPASLEVHPAPSSVAVAFGRLGVPWDDAAVVSAHGRPLEDAVAAAAGAPKVAVLTSPTNPPEAVGKALLATGAGERRVAVCSRLGTPHEAIVETDLAGLAAGAFDGR
jgi:precorrin-6Y C5,15-methyltransferase (decarboxylating)